jgi:hypothetical protein
VDDVFDRLQRNDVRYRFALAHALGPATSATGAGGLVSGPVPAPGII